MSAELERDDEEYQALSRWAVLALLFGVLSITVLVHVIFWIVPAIAVLMGVVGLSQTRHSEYVGRKAAIAGLCLAVFFAACAETRHLLRRRMIYKQAASHATEWLNLVREGKLYRAHQLLKPPMMRAPQDVSLNEYYANEVEEKAEAEAYFSEDPVNQIVLHGEKASISFVRNLRHYRKKLEDTVDQLYHLEYEVDGERVVKPIQTRLMRRYDYEEDQCHWEFHGILVPADT